MSTPKVVKRTAPLLLGAAFAAEALFAVWAIGLDRPPQCPKTRWEEVYEDARFVTYRITEYRLNEECEPVGHVTFKMLEKE